MNFALEAVRALKACWRLVCLDEDGFDDLDLSSDGFWHSFAAIILAAPLHMYASAATARMVVPPKPEPHWLSAFALFALLWVLWPLVMLTVSRLLDRRHNYVRFVVAANWLAVYVMAAYVLVLLPQQLGMVGSGIGQLLALCVSLWSLYFGWYIAKTALEVPAMTAAMVVAGEIALSIAVSAFV